MKIFFWPPKVTNFIFKICQYIKKKTIISSAKVRENPPATKMLKIGSNKLCEQRDGERSKGGERMEKTRLR